MALKPAYSGSYALFICSSIVRIWGSNSSKQPERNAFWICSKAS